MDKKLLQEKIKEVSNNLVANSKDAHWAKNAIQELLSLKGQLSVEPTELDCGVAEKELKADTFKIVATNKGVLYHQYGGYSVFVTPNLTALYGTLVDLVNNKEEYEKLEGTERVDFELTVSSIIYCVSLPTIVFTDAEFTYDIASSVVKFIRSQYDKFTEQPLQDETPIEDEQFKQAVMAIEQIEEEMKKES